ncbi:MAG: hypothetical protein GY711_08175 [bacterium]|nr:hypothetical protein [bacterium]
MQLFRGNALRPSVATLLATALLVGVADGARLRDGFEGVVFVVTNHGASQVRVFDEVTGQVQTVLSDVQFLPLALAGYARKDRLRRDLPTLSEGAAPVSGVSLAGSGSIYRIAQGGSESLLLVRGDELPRLLLTIPSGGLAGTIHASADGQWVLAASEPGSGGDVYAVSTAPGSTPILLTGALAPLDDLDPASLRGDGSVAWFVDDGDLYRASVTQGANASPVDLPGSEPVSPELLIAHDTGAVVALTERPDDKRRVFLVQPDGSFVSVSHTNDFHEYSLPSLDHPLGPFLAVSNDGRFVAFRREFGTEHELELFDANATSLTDLTEPPDYPNYIDSIGVLAFAQPTVLCFFAGDNHAHPHDPTTSIAAADMYAVDLSGADPAFTNITRTSGQSVPPFTENATLEFNRALVGPNAERIFLFGTDPNEGSLACFRVDGANNPFLPNVQQLTGPLAADPGIAGSTLGLLLHAAPVEPVPPYAQPVSRVDCSGDPACEPIVRILASDKEDPFESSARVWFDGTVKLGQTFVADAVAAGESKLKNETYVHVFDPQNTLLQSVKFHTSCSQPLELGDRFGSALLVDAVGEDQPPENTTDYCTYGSKPRLLRMSYTGEGCEATEHGQAPDKVECSGSPNAAPLVHIRASDKNNPDDSHAKVWFEGPVALGEDFYLDAYYAGENELKSDTHLHVFTESGVLLQYVKFHTSCSQPLRPMDQFGCALLLDCVLVDPVDPGNACAAGRPRSLTFAYLGAGCGPRTLGPEVRRLGPIDRMLPGHVAFANRTATRLPFTFPEGTRIESITPSRDGRRIAFIRRTEAGLEHAHVAHMGVGIVAQAPGAPSAGMRVGFSHSGALGVVRRETSGTVVVLVPMQGPAVTIDSTPGAAWFLTL